MMVRRWQDWLNMLLGAWLFVSPWAMNFATDVQPAAANAHTLGIAIFVFAAVAVYMPKVWEEAINIALGVWLIISPWAIGYNTHAAVSLNAVIVGLLVAGLAVWAMLRDSDFEKWWHQQHAA